MSIPFDSEETRMQRDAAPQMRSWDPTNGSPLIIQWG